MAEEKKTTEKTKSGGGLKRYRLVGDIWYGGAYVPAGSVIEVPAEVKPGKVWREVDATTAVTVASAPVVRIDGRASDADL